MSTVDERKQQVGEASWKGAEARWFWVGWFSFHWWYKKCLVMVNIAMTNWYISHSHHLNYAEIEGSGFSEEFTGVNPAFFQAMYRKLLWAKWTALLIKLQDIGNAALR